MTKIELIGTIGSFEASASGVRLAVGQADPAQPLDVRIHSPGGDVLEGEAILSALRGHPGGFQVTVEGMAFSMAANIALQAGKLSMPADGWLMFHRARFNRGGTAAELATKSRVLETMDSALLDKLEERVSGVPRATLQARLEAEWWLSGAEAVELGLAHSLTESAALAAVAHDAFSSAPAACLEYLDKPEASNRTKGKRESDNEPPPPIILAVRQPFRRSHP